MAERRIVTYGDPVLREVSEAVEIINQQVKDLVSDLVDTLKKAKGLGLSAVQIGVLQRVFIVDLSAVDITETLRVFINPEIVQSEGEIEMEEGCLSFPGIYQKIVRPAKVKVKALDLEGREYVLEASGLAARALLHEYDHLEGILYIERMTPLTRTLLRGRLRKLAKSSCAA
ncbi:MAG: peptide deformylase [candidate division Zixibacteria bacterium]|nr:peptide deformylase [candidate division Zixibacteria bacterium]MDH3936642.1 peptide deformylase [candidate division Zixibacteria bacterium]